jgi:hypothetical protein
VEGTNKAHENGEAMGFVGVRLTVMLGHGYLFWVLHFMCAVALSALQRNKPKVILVNDVACRINR